MPLPEGARLLADTPAGLLVGPRKDVRQAAGGPVEVLDPATGRVRARLADEGLVLAARGADVVVTPCPTCPLTLHDLRVGADAPQPLPGAAGDLAGVEAAALAPDGRHLALVVPAGAPDRWDVVLTHLPGPTHLPGGDERAAGTLPALRGLPGPVEGATPPLDWTPSGWLVVSDGTSLYAVAPGPHAAYRVDVVVPQHRTLSVS